VSLLAAATRKRSKHYQPANAPRNRSVLLLGSAGAVRYLSHARRMSSCRLFASAPEHAKSRTGLAASPLGWASCVGHARGFEQALPAHDAHLAAYRDAADPKDERITGQTPVYGNLTIKRWPATP